VEKMLAALSTKWDPEGLVDDASYCLPKARKSSHVDHFWARVFGSEGSPACLSRSLR
jgi:hypothetical protein